MQASSVTMPATTLAGFKTPIGGGSALCVSLRTALARAQALSEQADHEAAQADVIAAF